MKRNNKNTITINSGFTYKTFTKEFMEQFLKLIPRYLDNKVIQNLQKTVEFPGFRKGAVPAAKIRGQLGTVMRIQNLYLTQVWQECSPGNGTQEDENQNTAENLPGRAALALLMASEEGTDALLQDYLNEWTMYHRNETIQENDSLQYLLAAAKETAEKPEEKEAGNEPDKDVNPGKSTEIRRPEQEAPAATSDENKDRVVFLGNLEIVKRAPNSIFYNFYPQAELVPGTGIFMPMEWKYRKEEFPTYGAFSIHTLNFRNMIKQLKNGKIYVMKIEDYDEIEDNRGANSFTKKKISWEYLQSLNLLQEPYAGNYQYYPVYKIESFSELLAESDQMILDFPEDTEINDQIMLRDKLGNYYGPFDVKKDRESRQFISFLATDHPYIFDVFTERDPESDSSITLLPPVGGAGSVDLVVNKAELASETVDFASDSILIGEWEKLRNAAASGEKALSPFFSDDLPDQIGQKRRQRVEKLNEQMTLLTEKFTKFDEDFKRILLNASKNNDPAFSDLLAHSAADENFMQQFSQNRAITEAIEKNDAKLHEIEQQIETAQFKLDEKKQQQIQEELNRYQEEIERYKQEEEAYQSRLAAYQLSDDVIELTRELETLREEKDKLEKTSESLNEQCRMILQGFEEKTQNYLSEIADIQIHQKIAAVLNGTPAEPTGEESPEALPDGAISKYVSLCETTGLEGASLLDEIVKRFQAYRNYSKNEIINLLICFTQGFLTVFSGAPGTGKTSACLILAHALGLDHSALEDECRRVLVPVERGWSSKRDLIGYYNPLTKTFDKSNGAVYRLLEEGNRECELGKELDVMPAAIILDEANLSQMEYYWASFMNITDNSLTAQRIDLGNDISFRISRSLRFLATINNDHTTETLSPRLIDRAWFVTLPAGTSYGKIDFMESYSPVSMSKLKSLFSGKANLSMAEAILDKVDEVCGRYGIIISSRVKGAVHDYCAAGTGLFEAEKKVGRDGAVIAADYAIAEKILPELQGQGEDFGSKFLPELDAIFKENNLDKSLGLIRRMKGLGDARMNFYQFFM